MEGNMRGFWKLLLTPLSSEERKNVFTRLAEGSTQGRCNSRCVSFRNGINRAISRKLQQFTMTRALIWKGIGVEAEMADSRMVPRP